MAEEKTSYQQGAGVSDSLVDQEAPPKRDGGICAPWKWFCESPLKRYQFLIFLLFGGLTIVWLLMFIVSGGNDSTAYILAGVAAIIMSGYGANHFRILLGLKEQVDKMSKLNREFRAENAALQQEVDKLSRAREQLSSVEAGLKESNRKLKENVEKFRKLDENLKKLADSNIEGLEKLQKSSEQVMKTMQESLVRHEKEILNKVFDHLELGDNREGLTKAEFEEFWKQMPSSYAERWRKKKQKFEDIAGDDGILDYDEFTKLCDQFAEDEAKSGGSHDS
mmetsp:Transcript_61275/g.97535  ORF Transcript_61275/g.97535 Transcript_61275/m.97535 type:complete len:279 (-) Transcript_61275:1047-1883(-)